MSVLVNYFHTVYFSVNYVYLDESTTDNNGTPVSIGEAGPRAQKQSGCGFVGCTGTAGVRMECK